MLKSHPGNFKFFDDWFTQNHPEGKNLLQAECKSKEATLNLFEDLLKEHRFDIIQIVREMSGEAGMWCEMKSVRVSMGYNSNPDPYYESYDEEEDYRTQ